ncbi:hypothetical protein Tco_0687908 [Tanacetum coccineum]
MARVELHVSLQYNVEKWQLKFETQRLMLLTVLCSLYAMKTRFLVKDLSPQLLDGTVLESGVLVTKASYFKWLL